MTLIELCFVICAGIYGVLVLTTFFLDSLDKKLNVMAVLTKVFFIGFLLSMGICAFIQFRH